MSNPLYTAMQGGNQANTIREQIARLKQTIKGDPNAQIQQLLNSGKVSQEQYNRAIQQAREIQKMLGC